MFEPKALRQRAELIENTDLSSEALLNGLSADKFEQRLATLFKSVDIDHSGNLDQEEFFMCLQSLELQLTKGEMQALFDQADGNSNKAITFDEFIRFFSHNLLSLEREKHLRQLQKNLKRDKRKKKGDGETDATAMGRFPLLLLYFLVLSLVDRLFRTVFFASYVRDLTNTTPLLIHY